MTNAIGYDSWLEEPYQQQAAEEEAAEDAEEMEYQARVERDAKLVGLLAQCAPILDRVAVLDGNNVPYETLLHLRADIALVLNAERIKGSRR